MLTRLSFVLFSVAALAFDASPSSSSSSSSSLTVVFASPARHHHPRHHESPSSSSSLSARLSEISSELERLEEFVSEEQQQRQEEEEEPEPINEFSDENDYFADSDAAEAPAPRRPVKIQKTQRRPVNSKVTRKLPKASLQQAAGSKKRILIPVPHYGFDPTEAATPWAKVVEAGHIVTFATPDGQQAGCDNIMLTGAKLPIALKSLLMAQPEAVKLYGQMNRTKEFMNPIRWDAIVPSDYDVLLLPGGHDKGMIPYLDSTALHTVVAHFFESNKPVAAICHGTLLAGKSPHTKADASGVKRSVLYGRQTTGLQKGQELTAWVLTKTVLGDYYRTYPEVTMQDDLVSKLKSPSDYHAGPPPLFRDTDTRPWLRDLVGFTILDGNYLSARWPGDAHKFSDQLLKLIARN